MAIDDNKVYGLSGAQLKELPGKIEAVKGLARELTAADYNWPTSNPDGVALWLLEPGAYSNNAEIKVYLDSQNSHTDHGLNVTTGLEGNYATILRIRSITAEATLVRTMRNGTQQGLSYLPRPVVDSLDSIYTDRALSANQGKVLKDMIDALPTGGITELTTADYNYPASDPTYIAAWLLPAGTYTIAEDTVYVGFDTSNYGGYRTGYTFTVLADEGGTAANNHKVIISPYEGTLHIVGRGNGARISEKRLRDAITSVVDNLTSTSYSEPLSAKQGKVLKDLVDSLVIKGAGAPTTSTAGTVGMLYEDTTNGDLYICVDATNPYTWEEIGAGGSGPTVVQTTGTSTTDVMSQNAVSSMVYADPSSMRNVRIGYDSQVQGGVGQVAIGESSHAYAIGEAALASYSGPDTILQATQGVAYLNANNASFGYNNSHYRLLTGLYDPQGDHDAATKGYVDPSVDSTAPTTATAGRLGEIRIDTDTDTAYMCVKADTTTPKYTWKQITA